jgi:hypothetical protein
VSKSLVAPARRFIEAVGDALEQVSHGLAGVQRDRLRQDTALEAFNLASGLIGCDGRVTDDELVELIAAFGPQLETQLALATPSALRDSGLIERQAAFPAQRSAMFDVLLAADARDGSSYARTYYDHAVDLAFSVAAIDLHTAEAELEAIEAYRGTLLHAIEAMEADRSQPRTPTATPSSARADDPPRPIDDLLSELDHLVGLEGVKREVKLVTNLLRVQRVRRERGLPVVAQSRHLIFTGNPGTGKSTVARLLAQIYRALGLLQRGHLVESDRAGLVAGYVGQTAPLVLARFDEADQGMLLIDEAYSLVRGGERDFGREAIDTIVKLIEDRRDRIVVVMAGYPEEMDELIGSNPGLPSRFPKSIHFPDYTTDDLLLILDGLGETAGYHLDGGARDRARAWLDAVPRHRGFGNGRTARNLLEFAVATQASRLVAEPNPTNEALSTLTGADLPDPGTGPLTGGMPGVSSV